MKFDFFIESLGRFGAFALLLNYLLALSLYVFGVLIYIGREAGIVLSLPVFLFLIPSVVLVDTGLLIAYLFKRKHILILTKNDN